MGSLRSGHPPIRAKQRLRAEIGSRTTSNVRYPKSDLEQVWTSARLLSASTLVRTGRHNRYRPCIEYWISIYSGNTAGLARDTAVGGDLHQFGLYLAPSSLDVVLLLSTQGHSSAVA